MKKQVIHPENDHDFLARALRSAQEAREKNQYISADAVVAKLEKRLADAKKEAARSVTGR